jgi:gas vesicle protein
MTDSRPSTLPLFLAGMGAGIALTMLLAPLSGSATRGLIRRKVQDGEDWAKDTATQMRDRISKATQCESTSHGVITTTRPEEAAEL